MHVPLATVRCYPRCWDGLTCNSHGVTFLEDLLYGPLAFTSPESRKLSIKLPLPVTR